MISMAEEKTEEEYTPPTKEDILRFGDVNVEVSALLGNINMPIEQFLKLSRGAIVELNKNKDEDIDIMVNNHLFCKAEIVVAGENVGVKIKEIVGDSANQEPSEEAEPQE